MRFAMRLLFTHNSQVDKWNHYRLDSIESESAIFEAELAGPEHQQQFLIDNLLTPPMQQPLIPVPLGTLRDIGSERCL